MTEIHLQTKVLPGHRVVVADPALPEGVAVSVTVRLTDEVDEVSALEFLESLPASRLYASAEDADDALRQERESWD